jgi:hypothetical protein
LVRVIIDSHPNISCGPKTVFLDKVVDAVIGKQLPDYLDRFGFPEAYWYERVAELFDRIHSDYALRRGKHRWADKTGTYAMHIDMLDKLFPDCQVVHVIRDGRDVVASHRKRFGYVPAVKATRKWPVYVGTARAAGQRLGPERYHEVRYETLVTETEPTVRGLLDFLGEPWDDAVMEWDKKQHDMSAKYDTYTAERRAAGGENSAVYRSGVGSGKRDLDPLLRVACRVLEGGTLRELGYL